MSAHILQSMAIVTVVKPILDAPTVTTNTSAYVRMHMSSFLSTDHVLKAFAVHLSENTPVALRQSKEIMLLHLQHLMKLKYDDYSILQVENGDVLVLKSWIKVVSESPEFKSLPEYPFMF